MKNISILAMVLFISIAILPAQKQITVEDVWASSQFNARTVPGFRFMNDGVHYSRLESGSIN
jgi:hypothetical protein